MILIIPDIHGRDFWKVPFADIIEKKIQFDEIIFLGDYFDPYSYENITEVDAIFNWHNLNKSLRKVSWSSPVKFTFLLGNHDFKYVNDDFMKMAGGDKTMIHTLNEVKGIFKDNMMKFKLAYELKVNEKNFLFTHAGVNKNWYERHKDLIGPLSASNLNALQFTKEGVEALSEVGYMRGGNCETGGMLWADVSDNKEKVEPFDYQIFSHTQQMKDPIITENYAMLDCRKPFILDDEGNIIDYETYDKN